MSRSIVVVGAGGGGCAAAAEFSLLGHRVTLFNRSEHRLTPLREVGGVCFRSEGTNHGLTPLHRITTDIGEAMGDADTVLVAAPTSALGYYAEQMAPFLTDRHRLLLAPGHTGGALYVWRILRDLRSDLETVVGETHTLPYICRKTAPAEVTVWRHAQTLMMSALPAQRVQELHEVFADFIPALKPCRTVLETSLSNHNAVMHPPGMILNAGWIERTSGGFRYYAEGHTEAVGRVIDAIDRERLATAAAFEAELPSFLDTFYRTGYTTIESWRSGDVARAITESAPNSTIQAPSSLDHRYVHEDFGYGLVPMAALAEIAGVTTPTINMLIDLAEVATGFPLRVGGLNAERLGITGLSHERLIDLVAQN